MKNVLLASVMMFSVSAFALDASSSWQEINASYKTDVRAPKVAFAAGQATSFISIFDTCIAGDKIQTSKAFDVYAQTGNAKLGNLELVVVGQEVLTADLTTTKTFTNKNGQEMVITETIPMKNEIEVYENVSRKNTEARLMFTKSFEIPSCQ